MRKFKSKDIAYVAIMTALVTAVTSTTMVPIAGGKGYFNLGDTVILLCSVIFGPIYGAIAGGLGATIADLIVAPIWAPYTLVIKFAEGILAGIISHFAYKKLKEKKVNYLICALGVILASLWMVLGYFLASLAITRSLTVSSAESIGNLIQAGISSGLSIVILYSVKVLRMFVKDSPKEEIIKEDENEINKGD